MNTGAEGIDPTFTDRRTDGSHDVYNSSRVSSDDASAGNITDTVSY
ncbi:hypothetical protein R3Q06_01590 [Rhodococcus erythropolis]|nr:hypothetical protein [Rhodococcus erythropolis]MDV6272181.1 hypothetical protein [Rhodococcus erythropolis]